MPTEDMVNPHITCDEAADRIEQLEYALRSIADTPIGAEILAIYMQETAKDALKEGKDEQGTKPADHRTVE